MTDAQSQESPDYKAMEMAAEIEAKGIPADGGIGIFAKHHDDEQGNAQ